jgi:hypothetical protein
MNADMSIPLLARLDFQLLTCISPLVQDLQPSLACKGLTAGHETLGAKHRRPSRREVRELRVVGRMDHVPVDSRHVGSREVVMLWGRSNSGSG